MMAFLFVCNTIALKTPKSRDKNDGRLFLDYSGITTTEYKWTTKKTLKLELFLKHYMKSIIKASNLRKPLYYI
jgi:hypothetical protein